VKQISGAIARRIVCWLRLGEEVRAGDRYGMIKFGSRTDVIVPHDIVSATSVKVGDKVRGGVTILARLA
jgi:phosphatidylserine decarboxylase